VEGLVALEEPAVESFDGVCQLYVDDFDDGVMTMHDEMVSQPM
jgi:hypothetical protein